MMPPSPRLSRRMTNAMYFTPTIRMSDQTVSDSTPQTAASVGARPYSALKHARNAYSGLVPMSP